MKLQHKLLVGALGGVAGAAGMSALMLIGKQLGFVNNPIPHRIERKLERKAGAAEKTGPLQEAALAQGMHELIGASYGVVYGLLQPLVRLPALVFGPLYGLGVYVINEVFMGPELRLTPPPDDESQVTVARRIIMHLVYGSIIGVLWNRMENRLASG